MVQHRLFLDLALQGVDIGVGLRDALRERAVALGQRIDRIGDLLFGEAAHLGDHAREILQIGVEGLGRVQIGHCCCPSVADLGRIGLR